MSKRCFLLLLIGVFLSDLRLLDDEDDDEVDDELVEETVDPKHFCTFLLTNDDDDDEEEDDNDDCCGIDGRLWCSSIWPPNETRWSDEGSVLTVSGGIADPSNPGYAENDGIDGIWERGLVANCEGLPIHPISSIIGSSLEDFP